MMVLDLIPDCDLRSGFVALSIRKEIDDRKSVWWDGRWRKER